MHSSKYQLLLLLPVFFLGCRTTNQHSMMPLEQSAVSVSDGGTNQFYAFEETMHEIRSQRRVLFSANITLSVYEPEQTISMFQGIAEKYGGYINTVGTSRSVIRVKRDYFDVAINDISQLGQVQNKNITGQDVTDEYSDYQIRLENAEHARKRYLQLLARAENVEAALKVEKELERINESIDLLKGRMHRIDHLSDYSTISILVRQRNKPGVLGYLSLGIYHSVRWLFVRN